MNTQKPRSSAIKLTTVTQLKKENTWDIYIVFISFFHFHWLYMSMSLHCLHIIREQLLEIMFLNWWSHLEHSLAEGFVKNWLRMQFRSIDGLGYLISLSVLILSHHGNLQRFSLCSNNKDLLWLHFPIKIKMPMKIILIVPGANSLSQVRRVDENSEVINFKTI